MSREKPGYFTAAKAFLMSFCESMGGKMPFKRGNAKTIRAAAGARLADSRVSPRFSIAQRPAKWEIICRIYN